MRGQRAGGRGTRAGRPSNRPARDGGQRKQGQARERGQARGQARGPGQGQGQAQSQGRGRGADWATPGGLISGRTLPGLLLATGQLLPVTDIHRLAQTSGLTRLVMDADGCVLDVGRTARRATRRQRRTILTRYTRCMVDHCPMPAHLCQIDHITNWSDGGTTDLDNLGPTCQFHNRDRYRNPAHYQLHQVGKNRWGFTYLSPRTRTRQ
ncbi:HNH endonuclease signature motif containing protein [Microtetraspora malaysiensis]|uniref:HNH endonuclease signature motif containing protein n=1 Tax=Microtetraspora malaysiensis TaxID=161358 RepID=UPI003D8B32F5